MLSRQTGAKLDSYVADLLATVGLKKGAGQWKVRGRGQGLTCASPLNESPLALIC